MWALSCECKTDQTHFTDRTSFLPILPNLIEEMGPNPELLTTNA